MDNLNNMELHKAIKQMRLSRNLTQVKLVSEIGISTFTLIRWERGERLPDGEYLQKLARVLKYTMVLDTDGLWSCYPRDEPLSGEEWKTISQNENVDEIYRKASEAKDNAVWKSFFSKLVKDNARLEAWFRETNGGEDMDDKTFKVMSDVILAMASPER
jgi:transcriptional regulator with XRE-family HTH domain